MTHESQATRRLFASRPCELCPYLGLKCRGWTECFHIIHAGMGAGRRLDVRYNCLSCCRYMHRAHHDGNAYDGRRLREEELFELVALREGLPNEVDLQQVLWLILRLPKDATLGMMHRSVALLRLHDRKVAWEVLREMGKIQ